ncbi:hypothetical protein HAX54_023386 [Datura stramonium]|uniref:Uncharacterized protein n=1 Tax=Datura stramonium TaxID=4076 RepID=A0ABS8Y648_DATST|nr:hypothetical protein [Datura stramonium]
MEEEWRRSYHKLASGGRHGAVNVAVSGEEEKRRNDDGEWCTGGGLRTLNGLHGKGKGEEIGELTLLE